MAYRSVTGSFASSMESISPIRWKRPRVDVSSNSTHFVLRAIPARPGPLRRTPWLGSLDHQGRELGIMRRWQVAGRPDPPRSSILIEETAEAIAALHPAVPGRR